MMSWKRDSKSSSFKKMESKEVKDGTKELNLIILVLKLTLYAMPLWSMEWTIYLIEILKKLLICQNSLKILRE
jgi:hypothetical protein